MQKLQRFLFSPLALAVILVKTKPDIVHLNTSLESKAFWHDAAYLMVARFFRKKFVYQVHGGELPEQFFGNNKVLTGFLRRLLTQHDELVLLASVEYEAYKAFACFKHLLVIPNAIDLNENFDTGEKSSNHSLIKLGYIGRLAHNKGAFEVIQALSL